MAIEDRKLMTENCVTCLVACTVRCLFMSRSTLDDGNLRLQARAAVLTAAQCATYNEAKTAWMKATNGGDTLSTHVGASMISGLVTTTLTAPVDVIKTNMFVGKSHTS